ncbi:MAG: hypothetical protein ISR65_11035 [Bacteriovoracaceae bacterium]|nr:hypothetical protein [Bacteriovoracaceae bacterium]
MISHEEKLSANVQLKQMINNYLTVHPNITLNAFANRSGISNTTLRRILDESSSSIPAPHTILNVVSYLHKEKRVSKLLDKVGGAIGEILNKSFNKFIFDEHQTKYSNNLNKLLQNFNYYIVYKLAANKKGTNDLEIRGILGDLGEKIVKELQQFKVIEKNEQAQYHAKDKNFALEIPIAINHLKELIKFYKTEEIHLGNNLFYSLSESLNERAIVKVKNIQREAIKGIHQVMSDEQSLGNIPYFLIALSDSMNYSSNRENIQ